MIERVISIKSQVTDFVKIVLLCGYFPGKFVEF